MTMATAVGKRGGLTGWWVIGVLGALALVQPLACGTAQAPDGPDLGAVLEDVGPEVVEPALAEFESRAGDLERAVADWAAGGGVDSTERERARAAFGQAMMSWQRLEVMQVGPLGSSLEVAGGEGRRDLMYAWPGVNPCRVDQEIVLAAWDNVDFFDSRLPNAQGLGALEHLLWSEGPDNVCPSQVEINSAGTWAALGEGEVQRRRAAFGEALAHRLVVRAQEARAVWATRFSAAVASAGDGAPYGSQVEAIQAIYDALFYLEIQTKDQKLARPLGLRDCTTPCPDEVELRDSGLGAVAIRANLEGFRALFSGGSGNGLDDLLREVGHPEVAETVFADLEAAILAAEAVDGPLDRAIVERPEQVRALHDALRVITTDLKGDVATLLLLQIPAEAAGDND
jgi:predicted lipoprotein